MNHRVLLTIAAAVLSSGLAGCGEKSIDYYYEHIKEAHQVLEDCVQKKGLESVRTDKNCANAFAAAQKREKDARVIQRKADEAALAKFGQPTPNK